MKIDSVSANNRKKAFEVSVGETEFAFPYAKLRHPPNSENRVESVFVDDELGSEAFTYRLADGTEDTLHIDAVREVAGDPEYLQELLMHRLTMQAREALEESKLSKRQVARLLGTSTSQLYRLLDPGNSQKSLGQLMALLGLTGRELSVNVHRKDRGRVTPHFVVFRSERGWGFRLLEGERVILGEDGFASKAEAFEAIRATKTATVPDFEGAVAP